jgi:NADH-quinone oxidoreductase subunit C/D
MNGPTLYDSIKEKIDEKVILYRQDTTDDILTLWISAGNILDFLKHLRKNITQPFRFLFDLTAIDERRRSFINGVPHSDFTIVYHLTSIDRNQDIRVKVPLTGEYPSIPSITSLWPSANWYEREIFDMFGIMFEGHPDLRRILMPKSWKGYPLRKEYAARATEWGPYVLTDQARDIAEDEYRFKPQDYGLDSHSDETDFMFINIGPQHPGTHGLLRLIVQLDGEDIMEVVPDIGFHHRGAEKMGERQTWHKYLPYTDRIDYLGGTLNEHPYCLSVEKLAGIQVPDRVNVIRILVNELYRIQSHLVMLGTYAQDLGQMSPVFFAFNDREKLFDIIQAITGARMHPGWFRIGGVTSDLPRGWEKMIMDFVNYFPKSIREFERAIITNRIFKARTFGIGLYTAREAVDWGVTGPGLRATGVDWDYRKKRPYGGYENFDFEVPTGKNGDCYDRTLVRMEEMRQSLKIVRQCVKNMPEGPYKSMHNLATPPLKEKTLKDIETLIHHFLGVSWGPVIPAGEAMIPTETSRGGNGYYLVSDGGTSPYRSRIRTPTLAHIQMVPLIARGYTVPDLLSILGAVDFVLSDLDR